MRQLVSRTWIGLMLLTAACGRFEASGLDPAIPNIPGAPGPVDLGDGTVPLPQLPSQSPDPADPSLKVIALDQAESVHFHKNGFLAFVAQLPKGTQILVPKEYQYVTWDFQSSSGTIQRSSTGFVGPVQVKWVPGNSVSEQQKSTMNQLPGGLFISASVVNRLQGIDGVFPALTAGKPNQGYLEIYEESGRLRKGFTKQLLARFGQRLNAGVEMSSLPSAEQHKWRRIFQELQLAADRTVPTPKSIIMTTKQDALQASIDYEKTGKIALNGAWTIATEATAVIHHFANAPCAETMSEFIRQAYTRASYDVTEDFNTQKGNYLIWHETNSVIGLSNALFKAGWIPWDARFFRPPVGAILMNEYGQTPGHTYIAAADDGRFIVDNGAPQGRDLRVTNPKTIAGQYLTGLFFLPPGINPAKW